MHKSMMYPLVILLPLAVFSKEAVLENAGRCGSMQDPRKSLHCREARAGRHACADRTRCRDPSTLDEIQLHVPPPPVWQLPDSTNNLSNKPTGNATLYGPDGPGLTTTAVDTWDAAMKFCAETAGHDGLATLADYCAGGEWGTLIFEAVSTDQWAPVADCSNCYVQVGDSGPGTYGWPTCALHSSVANENPDWGTQTGKKDWESNYVLCVDTENGRPNLPNNDSSETPVESELFRGAPEPSGIFMSVYQCSTKDAARRIGMTCESFPYYNGGYPIMAGIDWDDEWEHYRCLETGDGLEMSGSYCSKWSNKEDSETEYEIGIYECQETTTTTKGVPYCKKWTSRQKETKKCDLGVDSCEPNCLEPTYCRNTCCSEDASGYRQCWDCSYTPISEYEYSSAVCHNVTDQGACLYWTQEEFDEHNYHFREYEEYTCLELSKNGAYCRRWFGHIDSEEEFEISTCQCLDEDTDGSRSFCSQWACYEQGLSYFFPNYVWTLLVLIPSCMCCLCCSGEKECTPSAFFLLYAIGFVGLGIAVAFLSGLFGVLIIFVMCCMIFPCIAYNEEICIWIRTKYLRIKNIFHRSPEKPVEVAETPIEQEYEFQESAPKLPLATNVVADSEFLENVPMVPASEVAPIDSDTTE